MNPIVETLFNPKERKKKQKYRQNKRRIIIDLKTEQNKEKLIPGNQYLVKFYEI